MIGICSYLLIGTFFTFLIHGLFDLGEIEFTPSERLLSWTLWPIFMAIIILTFVKALIEE